MKKCLTWMVAATTALTLVSCGRQSASSPVSFDVPQGFELVEDADKKYNAARMYRSSDYSLINLSFTDKDPAFAATDSATLEHDLDKRLDSELGEDVTLQDFAFETGTVSECSAIFISYTLLYSKGSIGQNIVILDSDQTCTITYTDMSDGAWADAFADSIASISVR